MFLFSAIITPAKTVKENLPGKKVVVATSSVAYTDISRQLQSLGMKERSLIRICPFEDYI